MNCNQFWRKKNLHQRYTKKNSVYKEWRNSRYQTTVKTAGTHCWWRLAQCPGDSTQPRTGWFWDWNRHRRLFSRCPNSDVRPLGYGTGCDDAGAGRIRSAQVYARRLQRCSNLGRIWYAAPQLEKMLDEGADDSMTKPYADKVLVDKISQLACR